MTTEITRPIITIASHNKVLNCCDETCYRHGTKTIPCICGNFNQHLGYHQAIAENLHRLHQIRQRASHSYPGADRMLITLPVRIRQPAALQLRKLPASPPTEFGPQGQLRRPHPDQLPLHFEPDSDPTA